MTPTRYAGRHGGPGIDDRLPGPETIAALFTGAGTVIADPVSFPWHLMSDDDLRQPLLVDLTKCTADDLIALEQVLPVLTPDDRVAASPEQRRDLSRALPLPDAAFVHPMPSETDDLLAELAARKVTRAVVREALAPVLRSELYSVAGIEGARPLQVAEIGADDRWTEALLPRPHSLVPTTDPVNAPAESAAVVVLHGRAVTAETLAAARSMLTPGGLLVFVLDQDAVRGSSGPAPAELLDLLNESTKHHHVVEHVWTLSDRPGRPTVGGLLSVRPLGGAPTAGSPTT
jgi:hypothetical protein